ncbi:hypothetical protein EOS93_15315 [Rhizobium sp. RMa-01]|nr:hypothetical protein EOS93_15315 [Rhizobium sp. RMa-01]
MTTRPGSPWLVDKPRSLFSVILGLVPRICQRINRLQMLGTSPSMTEEKWSGSISRPRRTKARQ